jgi:hypothetical protein
MLANGHRILAQFEPLQAVLVKHGYGLVFINSGGLCQ